MQRRTFLNSAVFAAAACAGPLRAAARHGAQAAAALGADPAGVRLERIQASGHFRDGCFHNLRTTASAPDPARSSALLKFLLDDAPHARPCVRLPSVKTDLSALPDGRLVWLGHSGFFLQLPAFRIAVDPALHACFPVQTFFKPFAGADIYRPQDIPSLDVLIFTHDHYDHLDMRTAVELKERTARVICPLGVGAHLEYWGWEAERITELDWGESFQLSAKRRISCVPAQHFSGRALQRNLTLWAGFVLQLDGLCVYFSGDGGYGPHFREIASSFPRIDLAVVEDGQYSCDWPDIHLLPDAWKTAVGDLGARVVLPCHNSKFKLSHHGWCEPLQTARLGACSLNAALSTPLIGQAVPLDNAACGTNAWWEGLESSQAGRPTRTRL